MYTSANNSDLQKLKKMAEELQEIEWHAEDIRHPKNNAVPESDGSDDDSLDTADFEEEVENNTMQQMGGHVMRSRVSELKMVSKLAQM